MNLLSVESESRLLMAVKNLLKHKQFLLNGHPSAFSFLHIEATDASDCYIQERTVYIAQSFLAEILQCFNQNISPYDVVQIFDKKIDDFLRAWFYTLGNPESDLPQAFKFKGRISIQETEALMESIARENLLSVLGTGRSLSKHITEYLNTDDIATRKLLMTHTLPSVALKRRYNSHLNDQKKETVTEELSFSFVRAWLYWVNETPSTRASLPDEMRNYLIHHPQLYALWPNVTLLEKTLNAQDLFQIQDPEVLLTYLKSMDFYQPIYNKYSKKELMLYYAESKPELLILMLNHFESKPSNRNFDYLSLLMGLSRYTKHTENSEQPWIAAVHHVKSKVTSQALAESLMGELKEVLTRKKILESNSMFLAWLRLVLSEELIPSLSEVFNEPKTILDLFEQSIKSMERIEDKVERFEFLKQLGLTLKSTKTKYTSFYEILYLRDVLQSDLALERAYRLAQLFHEDISAEFSNGKPLFKQFVYRFSTLPTSSVIEDFDMTYIRNDMLRIHLEKTVKAVQTTESLTHRKPTFERF